MTDILGKAFKSYIEGNKETFLLVHTSYGEIETMPVEVFFRDYNHMPEREKYALSLCKGNTLDIGAGDGSHSLELQKQGLDVTAIDISPLAIEIMQQRGITGAIHADIFTFTSPPFDTLLLLMNGIGIGQNMKKIKLLLEQLKTLLQPDGQILLDSCDVSYIAETNIYETYIGEVTYQFEYKGELSEPFGWLYLTIPMLKKIASSVGFHCQIIYEEGESFLARLTLKKQS